MERIGDELTPHDPNGRRQDAIQCGNPSIGSVTTSRHIDMRALREGMDACIRPARAMNPKAF